MALTFERHSNGQPQTHALVMGIGGYRHLLGGNDPKAQVLPQIGLLGQLTSAPRSALAFTEFLLEAKDDWIQPLGSVELLLSQGPNDDFALPANLESSSATFDSIQQAYDRWRTRCDSHEDNIAIFYLCGHGVEKEEQFILTEDFGSSPNNAWRKAFAFDSTKMAMRKSRAKTQCFFVDACRQITDPLLEHDIQVSALETVSQEATEKECTFVMKATAGRETALGPRNGVAYCTQALIKALRGAAAEDRGAGWMVRTGIISDRITDILRGVKADQGFTQRCDCRVTKSTELLRVSGTPQVKLTVRCTPDQAEPLAHLSCRSLAQPTAATHDATGTSLEVEVDAGIYEVRAEFPGAEFRDANQLVAANPPKREERLECEQ